METTLYRGVRAPKKEVDGMCRHGLKSPLEKFYNGDRNIIKRFYDVDIDEVPFPEVVKVQETSTPDILNDPCRPLVSFSKRRKVALGYAGATEHPIYLIELRAPENMMVSLNEVRDKRMMDITAMFVELPGLAFIDAEVVSSKTSVPPDFITSISKIRTS